jgi:hypothetical protein
MQRRIKVLAKPVDRESGKRGQTHSGRERWATTRNRQMSCCRSFGACLPLERRPTGHEHEGVPEVR